MNDRDYLITMAGRVLCPTCESKACEGRRECKTVQEWIDKQIGKEK